MARSQRHLLERDGYDSGGYSLPVEEEEAP
jgi:hypothetical protein